MSLYDSGKRVLVIDAVSIEEVDNIKKSVIDLDISFIAVDPGPLTERLFYHNGYLNCKFKMEIVGKYYKSRWKNSFSYSWKCNSSN